MPFFQPDLLAALTILGQSFEWPDLVIVGLLVLLEGLLSIDNALVLGILAKRLPKEMRARALSYGLIGAFVFRVIAILMASFLLKWTFVKLLGGGYLIFIALKHLFFEQKETADNKVVLDADGQPALIDARTGSKLSDTQEYLEIEQRVPVGTSMLGLDETNASADPEKTGETCNRIKGAEGAFWRTVIVIELTDIAFAVDSILAAMALAGSEPSKLWVVIVGGILGVVLMRFAAAIFIKLLDRFPRFELSAYLLVIVIGMKLVIDWGCNSDWSFDRTPWLAKNLGAWHESFSDFEKQRRLAVKGYEGWLHDSWPLGFAGHAESKPNAIERTPHLLDFHDLRRPETIAFWSLMAISFGVGFVPKRVETET
jgi:predicted tellurium resistance membrane protein TerC